MITDELVPDVRWWRLVARRSRQLALAALLLFQASVLVVCLDLLDSDVLLALLGMDPLAWTPAQLWARPGVRWGSRVAVVALPVAITSFGASLGFGYLAGAGGTYQWRLQRRALGGRKRAEPRLVWRIALGLEVTGAWRPETVHRWLDTFGAADLPTDEERTFLKEVKVAMRDAETLAREQLGAGAAGDAVVPWVRWAANDYLAEDLVILAEHAAVRCGDLVFRSRPKDDFVVHLPW